MNPNGFLTKLGYGKKTPNPTYVLNFKFFSLQTLRLTRGQKIGIHPTWFLKSIESDPIDLIPRLRCTPSGLPCVTIP